ncbi:EF-hand calcium-binding domain-containing protein 14-like [Petaurus breviceps papuanus]|uniref:EF-hand calcium-binding domain-containing protein 14-like n=1 Tax=Petaurus breviceps papuanus TaxID=3040969 RepID=UPI0036D79919
MSTNLELHKTKEIIVQLQNHLLNLTDQFLSMEAIIDSLVHSGDLQHPVDEKLNILEKQLENTTVVLTNLQKHLEEGLDTTFVQISQLKDGFYFLEDSKNHTSTDSDKRYPLPAKPSQETKVKLSTPLLPFVTSSPNYDVSVPESTSQIPEDAMDSETTQRKTKLNISFIKTLTDLQVFFYGADTNANGYLTYSEIQSLLGGEAPRQEQLKVFDEDNNNVYSYLEMIRAFELTE